MNWLILLLVGDGVSASRGSASLHHMITFVTNPGKVFVNTNFLIFFAWQRFLFCTPGGDWSCTVTWSQSDGLHKESRFCKDKCPRRWYPPSASLLWRGTTNSLKNYFKSLRMWWVIDCPEAYSIWLRYDFSMGTFIWKGAQILISLALTKISGANTALLGTIWKKSATMKQVQGWSLGVIGTQQAQIPTALVLYFDKLDCPS